MIDHSFRVLAQARANVSTVSTRVLVEGTYEADIRSSGPNIAWIIICSKFVSSQPKSHHHSTRFSLVVALKIDPTGILSRDMSCEFS